MRLLLMLLMYLFASSLSAQPATHACAAVVDGVARLACYDKAFPPSPETVEAAAKQVQADFGLNKPKQAYPVAGQASGQAEPASVELRVARVDYHGKGQRTFVFDNGQVWVQTESKSIGHIQAGDVAQVRKAMMGNHVLVTAGDVRLGVRRVR